MKADIVALLYLVSGVLFILALRGLSSPVSSRGGNRAGMVGMAKSMAREYASRNITVNCVAPGYIATEMTDALLPEVQAKLKNDMPLGSFAPGDYVIELTAKSNGDSVRKLVAFPIVG